MSLQETTVASPLRHLVTCSNPHFRNASIESSTGRSRNTPLTSREQFTMADQLSPVSPVSRSPSIRRSGSNSNSVEKISPTPPEPVQSKHITAKTKVLPPDYDEATPPPSYPASIRSVRDAEVGAAAVAPVRKRFHRRHPWWCTLISIVALGAIICAGIFGGLCWSTDSGCYAGRHWPDKISGTTFTYSPTATSTIAPASSTAFAPGKKERLVYSEKAGRRPVVGSSITAMSFVDEKDYHTERFFFHDTHGQIYESSYNRRYPEGYPDATERKEDSWQLTMVPGAVMAVNTSLVAVEVQEEGRYKTTAIFFHGADEDRKDQAQIYQVLSHSPGSYENVTETPYHNSGKIDWRPLAAATVKTVDGERVMLAYYDDTTTGPNYQSKGVTFVDGLWNGSKPDPPLGSAIMEFQYLLPRTLTISDGSPLAIQRVTASDGQQGFIVAYHVERFLVTRLDFFISVKPESSPYSLLHKGSYELHDLASQNKDQYPSFALWPNLVPTDEDAFSVWSCSSIGCNRYFFGITRINANTTSDPDAKTYEDLTQYEVRMVNYNGGSAPIGADSRVVGKPVFTTGEGLVYVVDIQYGGEGSVREFVAVATPDGKSEAMREMGPVKLFDTKGLV